jgi:hypothetical protein
METLILIILTVFLGVCAIGSAFMHEDKNY